MQIYIPYLGLLLLLWPSSFMDTGLSGLLPWRKLYLGVCGMCFLWGLFFLGCIRRSMVTNDLLISDRDYWQLLSILYSLFLSLFHSMPVGFYTALQCI